MKKFLLIGLLLVFFSSMAFASSCIPVVGWGCSSFENCVTSYTPLPTGTCQPKSFAELFAGFSLSNVLCSPFGDLGGGICSAVLGSVVIPIISAILFGIILFVIIGYLFPFITGLFPVNMIVFAIGAFIGWVLGALFNVWWWAVIIIAVIAIAVYYAKVKK